MIQLYNVRKTYNCNKVNEVCAIDIPALTIEDGEYVCVLGKSGSGKTTLLNLIGGLDRPTQGEITVNGFKISGQQEKTLSTFRRDNIGYVFQSYNLVPELTGEENILYPCYLSKKPYDKEYFDHIVQLLDISERLDHLPGQMSGGQQQRVAIARALINKPKLLLCDEPTGNLDSVSADNVKALLNKIHRIYHPTLIVVTHNNDFVADCTRVITIGDGKIGGDEK